MALTKKNRLVKKDVTEVFRSGRSLNGDSIGLKVSRTKGNRSGVAVIVPVRVAPKAVARNTLRRRVSEALQPLVSQLDPGYLVVVSVRVATLPPSKKLKDELVAVLRKSGILNR